MAVIDNANNTVSYVGAVINIWSHIYYDGMEQEYAEVWDIENHKRLNVGVGYYGSDGANFTSKTAEIDITADVVKDMIHTYKARAWKAFEESVTEFKREIRAGIKAEVVRGRKVKKGTVLTVFWTGEKPDYTGRRLEKLAGCHDENGRKVWIKAEYLKSLTAVKSPNAKERRKFLQNYVRQNVGESLLNAYIDAKR